MQCHYFLRFSTSWLYLFFCRLFFSVTGALHAFMSSQTDFQKARLAVHREVVPANTNVRHDGDS